MAIKATQEIRAADTPNARSRSLKSFVVRVFAFLNLFFLYEVAELFILPIDYFTFRPWEALVTKNYDPSSTWRFYPNQHLVKQSIGAFDNFNRTKNPRHKLEEWFTDENGFRNRPRHALDGRYDLWIWGNSNVVGAFNNQADILTESVQRQCGVSSYSLGSGTIAPVYFQNGNFTKNPPRYFAVLLDLGPPPAIMDGFLKPNLTHFGIKTKEPSRWPEWLLVLLDRVDKQAGREWARSRSDVTELQRNVDNAKAWRAAQQATLSPQELPSLRLVADAPHSEAFASIERSISILRDTLIAFKAETILIFQPTPNQIITYLPLIERLRVQGYKVIAWYPNETLKDGVPPDYWHTEDSHWTEKAIAETAKRLCQVMAGGTGVASATSPISFAR